jgi:hypothetical protein
LFSSLSLKVKLKALEYLVFNSKILPTSIAFFSSKTVLPHLKQAFCSEIISLFIAIWHFGQT